MQKIKSKDIENIVSLLSLPISKLLFPYRVSVRYLAGYNKRAIIVTYIDVEKIKAINNTKV